MRKKLLFLLTTLLVTLSANAQYEYVDLGLPSGTLWATCNVGASSPEEFGDFFCWGETDGKKDWYDYGTYKYCMGSHLTLTKYCNNSEFGYNGFTDDKLVLDPEDDAATVNMGEDWCTPTLDQLYELGKCTRKWTEQNGVGGILFTGPNGNKMFLPAAGLAWRDDPQWLYMGRYLSNECNKGFCPTVWYLSFYYYQSVIEITSDGGRREYGCPVRAVRKLGDVYTEFVEETGTLTYYYDNMRKERTGVTEVYDPESTRFTGYNEKVLEGVIDPSMKNAPLASMRNMFYNLSKMTNIKGIDNLNTANVTDMSHMFDNCESLSYLNLSSFNTANVTDMSHMFDNCESLMSINLYSFNLENVTNMSFMFNNCQRLPNITFGSLNTKKLTEMNSMFRGCSHISEIYLNFFNTDKVKNMDLMFEGCENLTYIFCNYDWSSNDASSNNMFAGCKRLEGGKGTKFNSSAVNKAYARPDGGPSKPGYFTEALEIYTEFDESTGTLTFYNDSKRDQRTGLTEIFQDFVYEDPRYADYHDKVLKAVIDPSMKSARLTSTNTMFSDLSEMTSIEGLENLNTANVTTMERMFYYCKSLEELDLSSFNTAKVTNMNKMFYQCVSLKTLNISSFDIQKVEDMSSMFEYCTRLRTIYCNDDWSTSITQSADMFLDCRDLVGDKGTKYDENFTNRKYARPDGGESAPGYFSRTKINPREVYTEFVEETGTLTYYYDDKREERKGVTELYDPVENSSAVRFTGYNDKVVKAVIDPSMKKAPLTSTNGMFYGNMNSETIKIQSLYNMTTIEGLWNLNTAIMTDMQSMFFSCSALTMLDLSSFNTSKVTSMNGMFLGCNKLEVVDISSFDISNVTDLYMMFSGCTKLKTIYCSNDWSTSSARSGYMFSVCNSLVGGKGTVFDSKVIDNTYARPDGGESAPGYFTDDSLTRINSLTPALSKGEGAIYNLSGQRVNKPVQKGLYIINGKKVVK